MSAENFIEFVSKMKTKEYTLSVGCICICLQSVYMYAKLDIYSVMASIFFWLFSVAAVPCRDRNISKSSL